MLPNPTAAARALVVLLAAAATTFSAARASEDDPEAQSGEHSGQSEEEVFRTLRNGTSEERLEAARHLSRTLGQKLPDQDDPSRAVEELVDELIFALRQETDDWIARTLLDSLLWERNPALNRLFREAIHSDSVNVQALGVRRFTNQKDPEVVEALESLWERDRPPWVRPRLVEALAEQGSATHLDDLMRLTRDDDPEAREAAIEALGTLARPEAIPVLVRVARTGAPPDRADAIRALGAFPGSEEALQEVLRASRSEGWSILSAAVTALGRLRRPEADGRLIALLEAPPDPDLRAGIAEALEDSRDPITTAALVRLLHQPDFSLNSWTASTAVRVLHNRDDPDAVSGLSDLVRDPGEEAHDEIGDLMEYLSRDRSAGKRTISIVSHCSFGMRISPQDLRAWHVAPPPPLETIRCWEEPERAGDPEFQRRLPAGTLVVIDDHFERPDHHWVEIHGEGADGCWVMQDHLEQGPGEPEPLSWPRRHIRHELDIGTEELETLQAGRLTEAGLLDVFEPGDQVAGVALEIDAFDPEQVGLVRALLSEAETVLDDALRFVLRQTDPEAAAYIRDDREADLSGVDDAADGEDDSDADETTN